MLLLSYRGEHNCNYTYTFFINSSSTIFKCVHAEHSFHVKCCQHYVTCIITVRLSMTLCMEFTLSSNSWKYELQHRCS